MYVGTEGKKSQNSEDASEKEWVRENERLMLQRGWGSLVMSKIQANRKNEM